MTASLDQIGVPFEYRNRAKLVWLATILLGPLMFPICYFIWKIDGQENNAWYQFQLKQSLVIGLIYWFLCWTGLIWIASIAICIWAFLNIHKGDDFEIPFLGKIIRDL